MRPIEKTLAHATAAGTGVREAAFLLGRRILDGDPDAIAGAARELERSAIEAGPSLAAAERLLGRLGADSLVQFARRLAGRGRTREADEALELSAVLHLLDREITRANEIAGELASGVDEVASEIRAQATDGTGRVLGKA
ncbi:MAG TPA: hypothetical protein VFA95_15520 [Gammaproteobacteria bacterium]|nr:hypothetical protein [Gammaproteobacteria bacterium]